MRIDQLTDVLVQAVEQAEPEAVFGRINAGAGFRVQLPDGSLWIVRVETPFNWDAPVADFDPCTPSREDLTDGRA